MFEFRQRGSFNRTNSWLTKLLRGDIYNNLDTFGRLGVEALARATPKESGATAAAWSYVVHKGRTHSRIEWYNHNVNKGAVIAVLIQYGHATGTGGYVPGVDYINPAMHSVFEAAIRDVWEKVMT